MVYDSEKPWLRPFRRVFKTLLSSHAYKSEVIVASVKVLDLRLRPESAESITSIIAPFPKGGMLLNQTSLNLEPQIMWLVVSGKASRILCTELFEEVNDSAAISLDT